MRTAGSAVLVHQRGGAAAIDRLSGLLSEGCSLGSPNACFSYASLLRSRGRTADADRLTEWACAQESHPDACPQVAS